MKPITTEFSVKKGNTSSKEDSATFDTAAELFVATIFD